MKKFFSGVKSYFIDGVIFLLPVLVVLALLNKVMGFLKGFSTKMAAFFGIGNVFGFPGHTIVSGIAIILICIVLGILVRYGILGTFRNWLDKNLSDLIPGYKDYRDNTLKKINKEEEILPYQKVVLLKRDQGQIPAFLMNSLADGRHTIFIPTAGVLKQGIIRIENPENVTILHHVDIKKMSDVFKKMGVGLDALSLS